MGHRLAVIAAVALMALVSVTVGCEEEEECDEEGLDMCIEDCHGMYTSMNEILLHNECVYECYDEASCEQSCFGECLHEDCSSASTLMDYAWCQGDCDEQCPDEE
jgi:hypothetical protein